MAEDKEKKGGFNLDKGGVTNPSSTLEKVATSLSLTSEKATANRNSILEKTMTNRRASLRRVKLRVSRR